MNLADGRLLEDEEKRTVLEHLDERIARTLENGRLSPQTVIDACDALSQSLSAEEHLPALLELGFDPEVARDSLLEVKEMLGRDCLAAKLEAELGGHYWEPKQYTPQNRGEPVVERIAPLGVLLHIAAGNADGLPVFSVIEGLLAGNINILKLPGTGDPISGAVIMRLIEIEPALSDYIYVFDYSSGELEAIKKLADVSDAVVIWGGDAAVGAVRSLLSPETKIIEWGHKLSFAYVTEGGMRDADLSGLTHNICRTNQLFCTSCQGIFIDTDQMETVYRFCERFLKILEETAKQYSAKIDIGLQAQTTLRLYTESLDSLYREKRIFKGDGCSVIACADQVLESGMMHRSVWVKRLPRRELLRTLKPYKNHLHTVGLLCADSERAELSDLLCKTGVVRVTKGENMSSPYCGCAHDGEYPLRRYTKIVSYE